MEKSLVLEDGYIKELTIADMKEMEKLAQNHKLGYDAVGIYLHVGVANTDGTRYFKKLQDVDTLTIKQAQALQKEILTLNKLEEEKEEEEK